METDYRVQCPYCGELIWMEFYPQDGQNQEQIIDCEVCCRPIQYQVSFNQEGQAYIQTSRAQ